MIPELWVILLGVIAFLPMRFVWPRSACQSAAMAGDEGCEVGRGHANRIEDADVHEFAPCAKAVDCRRADAETARDLGHAEEILLDPGWTRSFVFRHCGMGDSGISLCYRPE